MVFNPRELHIIGVLTSLTTPQSLLSLFHNFHTESPVNFFNRSAAIWLSHVCSMVSTCLSLITYLTANIFCLRCNKTGSVCTAKHFWLCCADTKTNTDNSGVYYIKVNYRHIDNHGNRKINGSVNNHGNRRTKLTIATLIALVKKKATIITFVKKIVINASRRVKCLVWFETNLNFLNRF